MEIIIWVNWQILTRSAKSTYQTNNKDNQQQHNLPCQEPHETFSGRLHSADEPRGPGRQMRYPTTQKDARPRSQTPESPLRPIVQAIPPADCHGVVSGFCARTVMMTG